MFIVNHYRHDFEYVHPYEINLKKIVTNIYCNSMFSKQIFNNFFKFWDYLFDLLREKNIISHGSQPAQIITSFQPFKWLVYIHLGVIDKLDAYWLFCVILIKFLVIYKKISRFLKFLQDSQPLQYSY